MGGSVAQKRNPFLFEFSSLLAVTVTMSPGLGFFGSEVPQMTVSLAESVSYMGKRSESLRVDL